MPLNTKNGSLLVKDGKLQTDCGCCECSNAERYALWQQLISSPCTVIVQSSCKQQHAATCISPGFAQGESGIANKYFPANYTIFSAQRFFYLPTPDYSGSYSLSVDLTKSRTFWNGTQGNVLWRFSTAYVDISVVAHVNSYSPGLLPSTPTDGTSNTVFLPPGNAVSKSVRCPVVYTISARFPVYNLFSQTGFYDPAPYIEESYNGTRPEFARGGTFVRTLATAGASIAKINGYTSSFESGFYTVDQESPLYTGNQFKVLQAWWKSCTLNLTQQQLTDIVQGSNRNISWSGQGSSSGNLAALQETLCTPVAGGIDLLGAMGNVSTGLLRLPYATRPLQWLENSDNSDWLSDMSFDTYWDYSWGGLIRVHSKIFSESYKEVAEPNFEISLDVSFGNDE